MIAPGVRVARGPNWIWNDQGNKEFIECVYFQFKAFIFIISEYLHGIYLSFR